MASKAAKRSRVEGRAAKAGDGDGTPELAYQSGFGNEFASEAIKGALPEGQNNPQKCPFGLYAEQLSGSAFTAPRSSRAMQRTWLYRIRPSVVHGPYTEMDKGLMTNDFGACKLDPTQLRWNPLPHVGSGEAKDDGLGAGVEADFVAGLATMSGAGEPSMKAGMAVHVYRCNKSMTAARRVMHNADGDFLIVPQEGALTVRTEMGVLHVAPHEICVVQRGIRFAVDVDGPSRGYVCEVFGSHFTLPDLGPIGANGLANPRDFLYPVAAFEDVDETHTVVHKFGGALFATELPFSPFNVVAWHGNYCPYKYNLDRFNTMNSVSFDHPDPSIYCVLTAPTGEPGVAACDFVIFPPRWMVMEHSFRPPYYHRNTMTEFMGMIYGSYDAKRGFRPGGASLHSCMSAHGPDKATFHKASTDALEPEWFSGGLAFMFETTFMMRLTPWALSAAHLDAEYTAEAWEPLPHYFDPTKADVDIPKVPEDAKGGAGGAGGGGAGAGAGAGAKAKAKGKAPKGKAAAGGAGNGAAASASK